MTSRSAFSRPADIRAGTRPSPTPPQDRPHSTFVVGATLLVARLFLHVNLKTVPLLLILLLGLAPLRAEPEVYVTEIRLPLDLYTGDGILLRKGVFHLEVRREKEHHSLVFLKDQKILAVVNGKESVGETVETVLPVVGTHYLRSTAIPLGTAEERQLSETGRPQYQDDDRDWESSLRVYRGSDHDEVHFIFQKRKDWANWEPTVFRLFSSRPARTR